MNTTERAIADIQQHGYTRIPRVFDDDTVARTLATVQTLSADLADKPIRDIPRLDTGQHTVYNLQNKSLDCIKLLLGEATIRSVLMHFLNDSWHRQIPQGDPNYILRSYSARDNRVAAPMHIDSFIPYQGDLAVSMQVAIVLEDQNTQNGCTTVIPGSHQNGEYVSQDEAANATPIESTAGDVVIWDSRIWHGTLENRTGASRWSLIATFVRWWVKQGYDITGKLPQAIYEQLTDNEKAILGFCSIPLGDEFAGIDFKKGYDWLKPRVSDY